MNKHHLHQHKYHNHMHHHLLPSHHYHEDHQFQELYYLYNQNLLFDQDNNFLNYNHFHIPEHLQTILDKLLQQLDYNNKKYYMFQLLFHYIQEHLPIQHYYHHLHHHQNNTRHHLQKLLYLQDKYMQLVLYNLMYPNYNNLRHLLLNKLNHHFQDK